MNIKKHIPNFLTCCNLLCGCFGIIQVFYGNIQAASYCIYIACMFDFFDGFAARGLNVSSPIGKDLDSLSDMVSFGVLPGIIVFGLLSQNNFMVDFLLTGKIYIPLPSFPTSKWYGLLPFVGLIIPIFSALRLAKFNNDTRQSDKFIGLPTPANALFISALPFILKKISASNEYSFMFEVYDYYPFILPLLSIVLSLLLIAELPLIALKFKNFGWPDNKMRYILIISALILLVTLNITAIPIIIILYIILSLIENNLMKGKSNI